MSGHSKWAGIKHKKAIVDAQRGKAFTKVVREIMVAAKHGGGNPDGNPRLRLAMTKAREVNLPKDKIEQAIKKGTGELPGVSYEETVFEGYGPGGVAILVEALTDNKNRTAAEVRNIFTKRNGNLAGAGSVSWLFQRKGYILVGVSAADEERLREADGQECRGGDERHEDGKRLPVVQCGEGASGAAGLEHAPFLARRGRKVKR